MAGKISPDSHASSSRRMHTNLVAGTMMKKNEMALIKAHRPKKEKRARKYIIEPNSFLPAGIFALFFNAAYENDDDCRPSVHLLRV